MDLAPLSLPTAGACTPSSSPSGKPAQTNLLPLTLPDSQARGNASTLHLHSRVPASMRVGTLDWRLLTSPETIFHISLDLRAFDQLPWASDGPRLLISSELKTLTFKKIHPNLFYVYKCVSCVRYPWRREGCVRSLELESQVAVSRCVGAGN